jgi:uncharacterized protein with PIN domain
MAVNCQKCGRQYDVTLFQFGRTISCACGMRVGLEHRINLSKDEELKFFVDVNAASVVRWLRAVGIDTAWEDAIADDDLIRRAIEEKRYVLTLDKRILREFRADNVLLLKSNRAVEQFREIVAHFKIEKPRGLFTRCLHCNILLREASAEEISFVLPSHPMPDQVTFQYCPACSKVYWEGSHTRRMREVIESVFSSE